MSTPTTGRAITPALDVSGYVDLVLSDADTNTLVARAIANAQAGAWPDWIPREGQTEVVLLEVLAQIVAEAGYALNALPGYVTEVLLRFYGLSRNPGTPAVTTVRFSIATSPGAVTIPAGTLLVLDTGLGTAPATFGTDVALTVPAGSSSATVAATATAVGASVNGVAAGAPLTVLSSVPYIDGASLASVVTSGTEPEDGDAFLARGAPRFSRLTDTLTKPVHFTAAALETAGVARAATYEATTPGQTPGSTPGHVTVAVAGPNGAPLAADAKAALLAALQGGAYVLITVHLVDVTVTALNISATVTALPGFAASDVQASVAVALNAYLSPDTWAFGATVYATELVALIDGVIGVDRVVTVSTPAGAFANYALPGLAPLARLGTATVTVQT